MTDTTESITCPRCKRTSHNPNDVLNKYCGACFRFHDETAAVRAHGPYLNPKYHGLIVMHGQCLCGDPKCDWSCPKGANQPMDRT